MTWTRPPRPPEWGDQWWYDFPEAVVAVVFHEDAPRIHFDVAPGTSIWRVAVLGRRFIAQILPHIPEGRLVASTKSEVARALCRRLGGVEFAPGEFQWHR